MRHLAAFLLPFLLSAAASSAAPQLSSIRVSDIYRRLESTSALYQGIQQKQNSALQDIRAEQLRKSLNELQEIMSQLKSNSPPEGVTLEQLKQNYQVKREEAQTLQREFELFRNEINQEIRRELVAGMRQSLKLITDTARQVAQEKGYDLVLDRSGKSNSSVPVLLYAKNLPDLTEDVIAALAAAGHPSRSLEGSNVPEEIAPEQAPETPAVAPPGIVPSN